MVGQASSLRLRLISLPVSRGQDARYARSECSLQSRISRGEIAKDVLAMCYLRLISDYQSGRLFDAVLPGQQEARNVFVRAMLQV